jgi:hypothetical protein
MNFINFSLLNGLPMNQLVLGRLQTAFAIFNALGAIAGDKSIISGCETVGSNVTDGVVYVNGEVFEFKGGVAQSTVIIVEESTNLVFKDLNSYPVVKTRYVTFGVGTESMNWADFKRGFPTKDIVAGLAGKADQTAFDSLAAAFAIVATKMATIETGAEKNVQADWNQTANGADDFIKNKPTVLTVLRQGVFNVGDVGDTGGVNEINTVTFPNIGTNNYMVLGGMVSNSSNYVQDTNVTWAVRERTNTSFKLGLREISSGVVQNLSFEYILIPMA